MAVTVKLVLLLSLMTNLGNCVVHVITDSNFSTNCLQGEWMIEFYAPWCPACKGFTDTWNRFGDWGRSHRSDFKVGKLDVTQNAVTAGRFMIMALPTIYHIHDGVVRNFDGPRNLDGLKQFMEVWHNMEALPWWQQPTSTHMFLVGQVYWASQRMTDIQHYLMSEYQLPAYLIVIMIGVATILVGCICGGILVCASEMWSRRHRQPPSPRQPQQPVEASKDEKPSNENKDEKLANQNKDDSSETVRKRTKKVS
ncbi:thioredoxin-related transmembrane protein 1-like [Dysidea avara]|uniref:thioredoxin-related transmembrane protein 1-like n=1 Tax=Dysidea avara TaxID=196820 RepID=UPI00331A67DD